MDVYTFSHPRFYIHCFLFEKNLAKRQVLLFFPFLHTAFWYKLKIRMDTLLT